MSKTASVSLEDTTAAVSRDRELIVMSSVTARLDEQGRWVLPRKYVVGMSGYAHLWGSQTTALLRLSDRAGLSLDDLSVDAGSVPFAIEPLPRPPQLASRLRGFAAVLAGLTKETICLASVCRRLAVPLVYISEHSLHNRLAICRIETRNPIRRYKRQLQAYLHEPRVRSAIRGAAGIQCNGTPAFEAYAALSARPLLFFDSRVRQDMLAKESDVRGRVAQLTERKVLRLGFSGRLLAIKGVQYLPQLAERLAERGVAFTLDVCGDGPMREPMVQAIQVRRLEPLIRMRGVFAFERELVPFFKQQVDLFVCCHPQSDPSCTYLETMACGLPIAGFANDALRGIVQLSGAGWPAPIGDVGRLASIIEELSLQPKRIEEGAFWALQFAARHTFERTWGARIAHVRDCAADGAERSERC